MEFVKRVTGQTPEEDGAGASETAFWIDNAGSGVPFSLSIRYKNGRVAEGFSSSLYVRHKWLDQGGKVERLVLIFTVGGIYLEGQFLQKGLDALEDGRLKRIREQGESDIKIIERDNLDVREREKKQPIVSRVVVSPSFEAVLESEENLSEIAKAIKEAL